MVNITKIKELAKVQGISQTHICAKLGMKGSYLTDVANGKNSMSEERVIKIAQILGTTFEYLTDETDDPAPKAGVETAAQQTPTDDDIKVALFGGRGEVTDEMWNEVKQFVEFVKQKQGKK